MKWFLEGTQNELDRKAAGRGTDTGGVQAASKPELAAGIGDAPKVVIPGGSDQKTDQGDTGREHAAAGLLNEEKDALETSSLKKRPQPVDLRPLEGEERF